MSRSVIMASESPVYFPSPLVFSPTSAKTPPSSPRWTPPKKIMIACPPRKPKETTSSSESNTALKRKRPPMLDLKLPPTVSSWCSTTVKTPGKADDVVEAEEDGVYSVYCKRGRRGPMEDRYAAAVDPGERVRKKAFFGVFDGHGGSKAAEFAAKNLGNNIEAAMEAARSGEEGYSVERAIREGYIKTDEDFLKEGSRGGACCVTALISEGELSVSNAGDCRAGGYVDCCNGVWRIQGTLAVSRGIGDRYLKEWVIAEPETRTLRIKPELEFLILASDGLWDKWWDYDVLAVHKMFSPIEKLLFSEKGYHCYPSRRFVHQAQLRMVDECENGDGATAARRYSHQDHKTKEAGDSSDGVDSISFLPDVILQSILSSLPTEIAIKTSILSKRWRHVWSDTPCLSFDWIRPHGPKGDIINKILGRYKARKMISFKLNANLQDDIPYIDRWIEFAMSRNVENMSLVFGYDGDHKYHVPDSFYISNSFKQLSVKYSFIDLKLPSFPVSWTSLKILYLKSCKLSEECMDKILSGCPVLESLTLDFCDKLLVLDLSKYLRLRTLVIKRNIWVPGPTQIIAPHIHYLSLTNSQLPCTLVDVSSLKEARMEICFCALEDLEADFLQTMVLRMLEKLQHVDKLTFGENFLTVLTLAELRSIPIPRFKVKDLTLETMISQYVIPGIVRVLQNSPELKKLTTIHRMMFGTITSRKRAVGFFHPYTNDGGGGERVLWCAVKAIQEETPDLDCIVFTGDHDSSSDSLARRAVDRFGVSLLSPPKVLSLSRDSLG
ncbi:hypothetical protein Bca101_035254 [Brassica carinata]